MFITVEGGEGAGKSTLVNKLYDYLTKEKELFVVKTFEPGSTTLGKEIRQILLHKKEMTISSRAELLLFLADRAHHVETLIKPALNEDMVVICDRFSDSSIAYQGMARGTGDIEEICLFATGGIVPDLTFYLDIDPKIAFTRIKREKDRLEGELFTFHEQVRAGYQALAKKHKDRFYTLDATQDPNKVFTEALKILESKWSAPR